jgi:hypothetical protein
MKFQTATHTKRYRAKELIEGRNLIRQFDNSTIRKLNDSII